MKVNKFSLLKAFFTLENSEKKSFNVYFIR